MSNHYNILILDDHLVVRKGIKLFLNDKFKSYNVYESESYQSTIDIVARIQFDLIFLDININGIENIKIMKEVKEIQPDVKILVFSSHEEKQYGLRYPRWTASQSARCQAPHCQSRWRRRFYVS